MEPVTIEGYRLSPQQREVWLRRARGGQLRSQCSILIEGRVEDEALRRALHGIVKRHEALRTSYVCLAGMELPLQVIEEAGECELSYEEVELEEVGESEQRGLLAAVVSSERARELEVERGEVVRFCVVKLGEERRVVVVTASGLSADEWSMRQMVGEVSRGYEACVKSDGGAAEQTGEVVVQYADYAEWQQELHEAEEGEGGREYWRGVEEEVRKCGEVRLAMESQRGAGSEVPQIGERVFRVPTLVGVSGSECVQSTEFSRDEYSSEEIRLELGEELSGGVWESACREGVSEEVFLLSCWQTLLWRLSGQSTIVTHCFFDGRKIRNLHTCVGRFSRYLPIRTRFEKDFLFNETVEIVKKSLRTTYVNQEFYTVEERERSEVSGGSRVGYGYQEWPGAERRGGVRVSLEEVRTESESFKLMLGVVRRGEELEVRLEFDGSRYARERVEWIGEAMEELIEAVVSDGTQAVGQLPAVGARERERVLVEWNETEREEDLSRCVHELFEAQVERTPGAKAVVYEGEQVSYGELNERANQVGHKLRELGVRAETRVGILLERGVEMVVALLGTLKAGGAYVPLDPTYPAGRLQYLVGDAGVAVVLTQERLRAKVGEPEGAAVVCLDREWEEIGGQSKENLGVEMSVGNLAYLIYTSGSTGEPKAVMVEHRSVVNLWQGLREAIYGELPEVMGVSVNAPLSFDASVKQVVQLLSGHRLVVVPEQARRDGEELERYLREQGVGVVDTTPTQLRMLRELGAGGGRGDWAAVLIGGEAIEAGLWGELGAEEESRYYNVYGPTECTVDATVGKIGRGEGEPVIGRPLGNVRTYVLDERLAVVATGVAGQLYVGGAGVSRGYHQGAGQTAGRFVPDPFGGVGARLYATGDVVRYQGDGQLEYVGRMDHQVKVRGYRIELGEVEAALLRHAGVKEAVAVVREEVLGDQRLVAYVTAKVAGAGRVPQGGERSEGASYRLPNGMQVRHQNRNETEYLYDEIFRQRTYFRHGISLKRGDCVFDVGANIGMFSLFVGRRWPGVQVHAFEPVGALRESLESNLGRFGGLVRVHECGLSDGEREEEFSFYPRYTMMSGQSRYADAASEVKVIKQYLENEREQAGSRGAEAGELLEQADEVLEGRFRVEPQRCRLRRLSDVIREEGVERIELLKVDVQRAELDVLRGVAEVDWEKIEQVVMEVHEEEGTASEGRVREIEELLRERGYEVVSEQEELLAGTDRYNLYAVKQGREPGVESEAERAEGEQLVAGAWEEEVSGEALRRYLQERVPEYLVPSAIVVLEELPMTRHGKVDRRALPAPAGRSGELEELQGPRTPVEELLVNIWREVLRVEQVSVTANFFELGGHSLLATQLISRVRAAFAVEVPLRTLFERPTVAGLAERVEEALRGGEQTEIAAIERVARDGEAPLSFAQQRLWFLDQLEPGSYFYNSPKALRLEGRLEVGALERVLNEIVRRHEVLRTSFQAVGGEPVQVITPSVTISLPVTDLSHLGGAEREAEVKQLATAEAQRPFDLRQAPLLRASLLRLGETEHVVLFTMHHIVSDGWSLGVLVEEVAALYRAYVAGEESPLAELPVQYADYAVWQREQLQGAVLEKQLSYWKRRLGGQLPVLELPTDHARPAVQSYRGSHQYFSLPEELTRQLKELSRREGVTLYMTLLAAFQTLLSRYSGQDDIIVGSAIAGRTRMETEKLIGFFINSLALRTDLSGSPTFVELLGRVREVTLGAYAHQDIPFDKLVDELHSERSVSRAPIFQVTFGLQNAPREELRLGELEITQVGFHYEAVRYDLTVWAQERGEQLGLTWTYSSELFEEETMRRMHGHYLTLLLSIVSQPKTELSALDIFTEIEKQE